MRRRLVALFCLLLPIQGNATQLPPNAVLWLNGLLQPQTFGEHRKLAQQFNPLGPTPPSPGGSGFQAPSAGILLPSGGQIGVYVSKGGSDNNSCLAVFSAATTLAPESQQVNACLTLNHAVNVALNYDVLASRFSPPTGSLAATGGNLVVGFGAGSWAEDLYVNGQPRGVANIVPVPTVTPTYAQIWPGKILLVGQDNNGTSKITGSGNTCGSVVASYYADIGFFNIEVDGAKATCHSPLFMQINGMMENFGGLVVGPSGTNAEQFHVENNGSQFQNWGAYQLRPGPNSNSGIGISDHGEFIDSSGGGSIGGTTPTWSQFLFIRGGGMFQSNVAQPWGASPGGTGRQFIIEENALVDIPSAVIGNIPGSTIGFSGSGSHLHGPYVATVNTATGLGSGSASLTTDSGPYAGQIILSPAGTPLTLGNVQLNFPYLVFSGTNIATLAHCVVSPSAGGTGSWNNPFMLASDMQAATPNQVFYWANSVALTAGSTYKMNYSCGAGSE